MRKHLEDKWDRFIQHCLDHQTMQMGQSRPEHSERILRRDFWYFKIPADCSRLSPDSEKGVVCRQIGGRWGNVWVNCRQAGVYIPEEMVGYKVVNDIRIGYKEKQISYFFPGQISPKTGSFGFLFRRIWSLRTNNGLHERIFLKKIYPWWQGHGDGWDRTRGTEQQWAGAEYNATRGGWDKLSELS